MWSDYVIDASRIVAPTFLYYGSEEGSDPEWVERSPPTVSHTSFVLAFLDREYATNRAGTGTN